jgi:RND family efflux transporter MFP subunit
MKFVGIHIANFLRNNSIGLVFIIGVSSLVFLTRCDSSVGQNAPPPLLKVPVANPLHMAITEWDEYTGRFRAIEKVEVRSRLSGYIEQIRFNDGDIVKKGDVLFVIDQRPFQIALKQSEAEFEQAKADHRQAQSSFERVESLKDSRAISQEEYDQRKHLLYAAAARVDAAAANVERARLDLRFTVVTAPISGRVSEDYVTVGNLISGGNAQATLLTTIVSTDPVYFYFEGSESALLELTRRNLQDSLNDSEKVHNEIMVRLLDENEFSHKGALDFMDNEVDESTGTFRARAIIPNKNSVIESGMFGTARVLNNHATDVILIPDAVIATDQSQKIVFVLSDSNKVEARAVKLGPLYSSELRIIRSGISAEDKVIIGNIQKIGPGMEVDPEARAIASNLK